MQLFRENVIVAGACAALVVVSLSGTVQRLVKPYPIHRWESALVAEGYRCSLGLPVYEDPVTGHSTHMYGPLITYVAGFFFRWMGPSVYPLRFLSLGAAIASMLIVIRIAGRKSQPLVTLLAVAMLFALGHGVSDYIEPRPDTVSLLMAILATCLMYRGHQTGKLSWHSAGVVMTVVAFLFKQPAAMVCAIPVVAAVFAQQRPTLKQLAMLASPFAAILLTIGVIYLRFPIVFHYMFAVPGQFEVSREQLCRWAVAFPLSFPVVWLAYTLRLIVDKSPLMDARFRWIAAAVCVTVPCGIIAASKTGGMVNNLLPAGYAMVSLFLFCGKPLHDLLAASSIHQASQPGQSPPGQSPPGQSPAGRLTADLAGRRMVVSGLVVGLTLMSFFHGRMDMVRSDVFYGDEAYLNVVRFVSEVDGVVTCPQDPSIVALARRTPGRSIALENDEQLYPTEIPDYFFDDLQTAQYAIALGRRGDWRVWPLSAKERDDIFKRFGFRPSHENPFGDSSYVLWERADP